MGWVISSLRDYLVVDFDSHQNLLWVDLLDDLSEIKADWGPHSTVSPLWPIGRENGHPVRDHGLNQSGYFLFLNGRQAGAVLSDLKPRVSAQTLFWLSMGFYAVVMFVPIPEGELVKDGESAPFMTQADFTSQTASDARVVAEWIAQNQTRLSVEAWLVLEGEHRNRGNGGSTKFTYIACTEQLNELSVSATADGTLELLRSVAKKIVAPPAGRELEALVASASNILRRGVRSPLHLDDALSTSLLAAQHFAQTLETFPQQQLEVGYVFREIARGLADLEQQAATGISPIRYSASTVWPHTLLGLGTAVRALGCLDAFVAGPLARADFGKQLSALKRSHHVEEKISKLLGRPKPELRIPKLSFPLLPQQSMTRPLTRGATFNRQGAFESTTTHLRVPTHCLNGANCVADSIYPICHEFARAPAASIIEQSFEAALQDDHLSGFWQRYRSSAPRYPDDATAMLDYCAELVVREFKSTEIADDAGISTDYTAALYERCRDSPGLLRDFFLSRYNQFTQPISDTVTFIYFYRSDVQFFMQSYFSSWQSLKGSDPREDSIEVVVSRILGTVAGRRYGGDTFSSQRLRDDVVASLNALPARWRDRLSFAAAYIRQLSSTYLQRVEFNASIAFIVHQFFTSEELLATLWSDSFAKGGKFQPDAYSATLGTIGGPLRIGNPLAFLFSCARDFDPDEARAVWLIHYLAYYDATQET